ncbi:FecCD family ABC transporter permease [Sneathiella limimaris]|uniref:FecCD family ABC transporter permease n=1 Tax=Sneathiella limimaris TaxID=1964213 RepID=UPI00146E5CF8|nr:iron ABC transporter permease [Sneathiella limimaris]
MIAALRRFTAADRFSEKPPILGILIALAVLVLLAALFGASMGAIEIPVIQMISGTLSEFHQQVLVSIRIPRVLLAILVGAALGISGAAMQGIFRNPLADPTLIGITGGAALSVAFVIVFAGALTGIGGLYGLGFAAFIGGTITSLLILRLARISGVFSVTHMLLAGIAINALTFAGVGFLSFLSTDQQLREISMWTMGSLGGAMWEPVLVTATIILPCVFMITRKARELNILLLGEENATYIGVDTHKLKRVIVICAALCVGASVSVSGVIGFIGLVVPHLIRLTFGADHKLLIPGSALFGAALLLFADTIARTVAAPTEIPVGILTSLVGGPFFLWLLIRQSRGQI